MPTGSSWPADVLKGLQLVDRESFPPSVVVEPLKQLLLLSGGIRRQVNEDALNGYDMEMGETEGVGGATRRGEPGDSALMVKGGAKS